MWKRNDQTAVTQLFKEIINDSKQPKKTNSEIREEISYLNGLIQCLDDYTRAKKKLKEQRSQFESKEIPEITETVHTKTCRRHGNSYSLKETISTRKTTSNEISSEEMTELLKKKQQ